MGRYLDAVGYGSSSHPSPEGKLIKGPWGVLDTPEWDQSVADHVLEEAMRIAWPPEMTAALAWGMNHAVKLTEMIDATLREMDHTNHRDPAAFVRAVKKLMALMESVRTAYEKTFDRPIGGWYYTIAVCERNPERTR